MDFYDGATLVGTASAAPYTATLSNAAAGTHVLTAQATDNLGAVTTSAAVSVSVNTAVAQIYFVHTDHLNTPRLITSDTGQVVWNWANDDPYGNNTPNENPSGAGIFTYNLRLPGQYFDSETNLHYNYFRDYDPLAGRYVESDPIGLKGGINTYGYVSGNPINYVDPLGLSGVGDFASGFGSYYRGVYRTLRFGARSYGLFGRCEQQRSEEEDAIFQDAIELLRDNRQARSLVADQLSDYIGTHGAFLEGRITAGVVASQFIPGGPLLTPLAIYGDARYAIEMGADATQAITSGVSGIPESIRNVRRASNQCGCP